MYYSIDRFEDEWAVLEDDDGNSYDVLRSKLPKQANPSNVLVFENGEYKLDHEETKRRKEKIIELQNKLIKDDK